MKKVILIILLVNNLSYVFSQDTVVYKTVFGNLETTGFYYGINGKSTLISGKYTFDFGMNLAFIINDNVALGVQGNAFWQQPEFDDLLNDKFNLQGLYGGFFVEPIIFPFYAFHVTFPVYFGGGIIDYCEVGNDLLNHYDYYTYDEAGFAFAEPGIEIEMNVIEQLRLSLGAHYKFTSNINLFYDDETHIVPASVLNNFNFGLTLKFGTFYN